MEMIFYTAGFFCIGMGEVLRLTGNRAEPNGASPDLEPLALTKVY